MPDHVLIYRKPVDTDTPVEFVIPAGKIDDIFEFCNWVHDHLCPGERERMRQFELERARRAA